MQKKMKLKIVDNWRTGYKWFSNWAFIVIMFLATTPLPPEIASLLPQVMQDKLMAIVAVCGLVLRFIKQKDSANGLALPSHSTDSSKNGGADGLD